MFFSWLTIGEINMIKKVIQLLVATATTTSWANATFALHSESMITANDHNEWRIESEELLNYKNIEIVGTVSAAIELIKNNISLEEVIKFKEEKVPSEDEKFYAYDIVFLKQKGFEFNHVAKLRQLNFSHNQILHIAKIYSEPNLDTEKLIANINLFKEQNHPNDFIINCLSVNASLSDISSLTQQGFTLKEMNEYFKYEFNVEEAKKLKKGFISPECAKKYKDNNYDIDTAIQAMSDWELPDEHEPEEKINNLSCPPAEYVNSLSSHYKFIVNDIIKLHQNDFSLSDINMTFPNTEIEIAQQNIKKIIYLLDNGYNKYDVLHLRSTNDQKISLDMAYKLCLIGINKSYLKKIVKGKISLNAIEQLQKRNLSSQEIQNLLERDFSDLTLNTLFFLGINFKKKYMLNSDISNDNIEKILQKEISEERLKDRLKTIFFNLNNKQLTNLLNCIDKFKPPHRLVYFEKFLEKLATIECISEVLDSDLLCPKLLSKIIDYLSNNYEDQVIKVQEECGLTIEQIIHCWINGLDKNEIMLRKKLIEKIKKEKHVQLNIPFFENYQPEWRSDPNSQNFSNDDMKKIITEIMKDTEFCQGDPKNKFILDVNHYMFDNTSNMFQTQSKETQRLFMQILAHAPQIISNTDLRKYVTQALLSHDNACPNRLYAIITMIAEGLDKYLSGANNFCKAILTNYKISLFEKMILLHNDPSYATDNSNLKNKFKMFINHQYGMEFRNRYQDCVHRILGYPLTEISNIQLQFIELTKDIPISHTVIVTGIAHVFSLDNLIQSSEEQFSINCNSRQAALKYFTFNIEEYEIITGREKGRLKELAQQALEGLSLEITTLQKTISENEKNPDLNSRVKQYKTWYQDIEKYCSNKEFLNIDQTINLVGIIILYSNGGTEADSDEFLIGTDKDKITSFKETLKSKTEGIKIYASKFIKNLEDNGYFEKIAET